MKKKVAFICIHNSARSQMAEELLRKYAGNRFECFSAGIEPGKLNPVVIEVLKEEEGINISNKKIVSVYDLIKSKDKFDFVITVCDEGNAERCPIFFGDVKRLHWGFEDPSNLGVEEDKKKKTSEIKKQIFNKIMSWI